MALGRKGGQRIGLSWGDVEGAGRVAFPIIHTAGSGVLSAFGAGALVQPLTSLEQRGGLLPPSAPKPDRVVQKADFVILVSKMGQSPTMLAQPDAVGVTGGRRFDGNGYQSSSDLGSKFSFGYDAPASVDVSVKGKQATFSDVKQVLFCGGVETKNGPTNIAGDVMSKSGFGIVSTILGILGIGDEDDEGTYTVGAMPTAIVPQNKYVKGTIAQASKTILPTTPAGFGFQFKTSGKGRKFTSLVLNRKSRQNPKRTVEAARAVAKRAQQSGQAALARVSNAKTQIAKKTATHVVGLFGKAAVTTKTAASLAALEAQAHALIVAGQKLATQADKYEKIVTNNEALKRAGTLRAQQVTRIHGDDAVGAMGEYFTDILGASWDDIVGLRLWTEAIEAEYVGDILGDVYGAQPMPDPLRPGFMTDGSPDPSYGGGSAGAPASSGASGVAGPPDYGAGTPPQLAGGAIQMSDGTTWPAPNVDYMPDPYPNGDDPTFYDCPTDADLPLGAVVFDGSHQPQHMGLGNFSVFFGMVPGVAPPKGGPNSGYAYHGDGKWWLELMGTSPSTGYSGGHNFDTVDNPNSAMVAESEKNNWGPLLGNPQGGFTKGLRFSPSGPNGPRWFWFFDVAAQVAPWAVAALLQAELNDAITQYKAAVTAGQTDFVNAQLQDKLNQQTAAQQAQQQAAVDAQVAQQQEVADAQAAIQDQQLQQQYEKQTLAQQGAQQQQAQQQAAFDQQTQALQLQYFQQHPEAMYQPSDDGGGGGGGGAPDGGGMPDPNVDVENNIDWGGGGGDGGGGDDMPAANELTDEAESL